MKNPTKHIRRGSRKSNYSLSILLLPLLCAQLVNTGCGGGQDAFTTDGVDRHGTFSRVLPSLDNARDLQLQPGGNGVFLAGSVITTDMDARLVKTDAQGNLERTGTYDVGLDDYGYAVFETAAGGCVLGGITETSPRNTDALLVKTDANGTRQWINTYGGAGFDAAQEVLETSRGEVVFAGRTESFGSGSSDFWLVKTDEHGTRQWSRTYGGVGGDNAWSMLATTDGGYLLAGETNSFGAGRDDVWLVKTDEDGNEQWNKTIGGPESESAHSVARTRDGGYVVTGTMNNDDVLVVKTDASGNEQWSWTFGGSGMDWGQDVKQTADGGYVIAAFTESYGAGGRDAWLIKLDHNGMEQWNRTYGGAEDDHASSVVQGPDGGYFVAGASGSDGWLMKTDPSGRVFSP